MDPGEQQSHQMLAKTSPWATTARGNHLMRTFITRWQQSRLDAVRAPTRTLKERPEHRPTQGWFNDLVLKIVVIPLPKARNIAITLNISFRQRLELTFHIRSSLDLCHSCSLHSICRCMKYL